VTARADFATGTARWALAIGTVVWTLGTLAVPAAAAEPARKPTAPVSGTVTVDGKPLPAGLILIVPSDPVAGPPAIGAILDGVFGQVTTHKDNWGGGAPLGHAKILIQVMATSDVEIGDAYGHVEKTPLSTTIKPGRNRLRLELKSGRPPRPGPGPGRNLDGRKLTGPISGRVTVGGRPIPEGTIMFIPKHPNRGPAGQGVIRNGVYKQVTAYRRDPGGGALLGRNTVIIRLPQESPVQIDPKFGDPRKTPLEVVIKEGANTCDFDLPGKPKNAAAVSGTIQVGGHPLEAGIVLIVPKHPNKGPAAMGIVTKGKFKHVSAFRGMEAGGAIVGPAKVVVHVPQEATLQVPDKYTDPRSTPLEITVKAGENTVRFDVPGVELAGSGALVPVGLPTAPVFGTVRVGGKPLPEGTILLVPTEPGRGPAAVGTIKNGQFKGMTAYRRSPGGGAVPGRFKVVILAPSSSPVKVPPKYGDFAATPLRFDVKKGKNRLDIDIPVAPES